MGSCFVRLLCFLALCLCQDDACVVPVCDVCPMGGGGGRGLFLAVVPESLPRIFFTVLGQDVGSSALEGVWEWHG